MNKAFMTFSSVVADPRPAYPFATRRGIDLATARGSSASVQAVGQAKAAERTGEPPGVKRLVREALVCLRVGRFGRAHDKRGHVADLIATKTHHVQREWQIRSRLIVPGV